MAASYTLIRRVRIVVSSVLETLKAKNKIEKSKTKRSWMKDIFKERKRQGVFSNLVKELRLIVNSTSIEKKTYHDAFFFSHNTRWLRTTSAKVS